MPDLMAYDRRDDGETDTNAREPSELAVNPSQHVKDAHQDREHEDIGQIEHFKSLVRP